MHRQASTSLASELADPSRVLILLRRRLRGIVRTTIATCTPWTVLGFLVGTVLQLGGETGAVVLFGRAAPGGLVGAWTVAGALIGLVNGLVFSGLVLAAERGKSVEQLRGWRVATWGALATAGPLALLFASPLIAGLGAVTGAVGSLAALWFARRSPVRAAPLPAGPA